MRPASPALPSPLRWFAGLIATVCCCSLAFQLVLIVDTAAGMGVGWPFAIVVFAAFFTIQINLMSAIVTGLAAAGIDRWPGRGRIRSAIAAYMLSAGLVFLMILRPVFQHTGAQAVADALLHYLTPTLYGLFWLAAVPKHDLRWRDVAIWMIYPSIYLVVVLLFDRWSGFSHYPIFDMQRIDAGALAMNFVAVSSVFVAAGLLIVALGCKLGANGFGR